MEELQTQSQQQSATSGIHRARVPSGFLLQWGAVLGQSESEVQEVVHRQLCRAPGAGQHSQAEPAPQAGSCPQDGATTAWTSVGAAAS